MAERVAEKSRPTDCGCGHEVCPGVNYGSCPLPARKGLAEVLAEHGADVTSYDAGDIHGCDCRWQVPEMPNEVRWSGGDWDAYRAHLEAAVLSWVRERLAGAREDVERGLLAHVCSVSNLPEWMQVPATGRQMRPLTGPLADAALAAVAEVLGLGEVRG